MPATTPRLSRLALGLAACAAAVLAGCGTFNNASERLAAAVTPYKVQVVQGNFVSREQVEFLKPGMSRQQIRDVLGTPLLASAFHADRWDYVFTLRRNGVQEQSYRLALFFKGEQLERFEGDTMPTEAEFVSALDERRKAPKVPVLEATEAQLARFPAPAAAAPSAATPAPASAPATASYPPLEAPSR